MGLILDSTELIYAERHEIVVSQLLACYAPEAAVGISVLTLAELQYGLHRANSSALRQKRSHFLNIIQKDLDILPVTSTVALLAGTLNADLQATGERIALIDLIIAATALSRGDRLSTRNLRHFERVPNLEVISPDLTLATRLNPRVGEN